MTRRRKPSREVRLDGRESPRRLRLERARRMRLAEFQQETLANIRQSPQELDMILKKAVMSPELKTAVQEVKKAIENNDLQLAYELSAVKSLITGRIDSDPERHHFREEHEYNEKVLGGRSVYNRLDYIHHDLAFALDSMPSGTYVGGVHRGTGKGVIVYKGGPDFRGRKRKLPAKAHPILRRMAKELYLTREEARAAFRR